MKKIIIIFILIIQFYSVELFSQNTHEFEMWYKVSPEIALTVNDRFDFRFRPCDYTVTPDVAKARLDFMAGVKFWKFTLFDYTKIDNHEGAWTGPRLDFNIMLANNKLLIHTNERFFFGLNSKSTNHYYLVQLVTWSFNDWFNAGFLGYGKWNTTTVFKEGLWFMGPIIGFKLPYNIEIQLSTTIDIFDTKTYMSLFLLKYKIKYHKKEE